MAQSAGGRQSGRRKKPGKRLQRFIDLVHVELKGLHEGNIARFRLRPAEFATWHGLTRHVSPALPDGQGEYRIS